MLMFKKHALYARIGKCIKILANILVCVCVLKCSSVPVSLWNVSRSQGIASEYCQSCSPTPPDARYLSVCVQQRVYHRMVPTTTQRMDVQEHLSEGGVRKMVEGADRKSPILRSLVGLNTIKRISYICVFVCVCVCALNICLVTQTSHN